MDRLPSLPSFYIKMTPLTSLKRMAERVDRKYISNHILRMSNTYDIFKV
ncbi:hypothetical protein ACFPFV_01860 [Salinicoccus siamensis]